MKTKSTLALVTLASAFSLVCSNAFALVQPGWDHPVLKADMSVLNEQGTVPAVLAAAKNIELVMTQQDGTPSPAGFVLLIDGQANQSYSVSAISKDPCGTTVYTLVPLQAPGNYILSQAAQKLEVIDHSDSACMIFHKYRWEMNVQTQEPAHQAVGQMRLVGSPESLITPQ